MKPADLKKLRERIGMSTTELGAALGVSARTVDRWEAGISRISKLHLNALTTVLMGKQLPITNSMSVKMADKLTGRA